MKTNDNEKVVALFDVDGVLTDGSFLYDCEGKKYKRFGPDDAYALKLLEENGVEVRFISSDKRGFPISEKRVNDMGFTLTEVSHKIRPEWITENYPRSEYFRIYIGDSYADAAVFNVVEVGICPNNGHQIAKEYATYVTPTDGGNRAVADAVFWILKAICGKDVKKLLKLS